MNYATDNTEKNMDTSEKCSWYHLIERSIWSNNIDSKVKHIY